MAHVDQLYNLVNAENFEALQKSVRTLTSKLGFNQFVYARAASKEISAQGFLCVMSDYSPSWQKKYQEMNYGDIDPVREYCVKGSRFTPLIRNDDIYTNEQQRNFQEEALAFGIGFGVAFPILDGDGSRGAFNLTLPDKSQDALSLVNHKLAESLLLATYVHEAMRNLDKNKKTAAPATNLSLREKECLAWGAAGKSAWETGIILDISEWTVVYHIENAKKKLGVTKKNQAIARALALGLINP